MEQMISGSDLVISVYPKKRSMDMLKDLFGERIGSDMRT